MNGNLGYILVSKWVIFQQSVGIDQLTGTTLHQMLQVPAKLERDT